MNHGKCFSNGQSNTASVFSRLHDINIDSTDEPTGDLVYTTVFTRRLIVINSINAVDDLLNKRANVYSHRPYLYLYEVANRMLVVFNITTEHERFRTYRKLLQGELGPRAVDNYAPLLRSQTVLMLQRIAKNPDDFHGFIRQ
jgi:cytochrome P450